MAQNHWTLVKAPMLGPPQRCWFTGSAVGPETLHFPQVPAAPGPPPPPVRTTATRHRCPEAAPPVRWCSSVLPNKTGQPGPLATRHFWAQLARALSPGKAPHAAGGPRGLLCLCSHSWRAAACDLLRTPGFPSVQWADEGVPLDPVPAPRPLLVPRAHLCSTECAHPCGGSTASQWPPSSAKST